jgi:hypothetical protein
VSGQGRPSATASLAADRSPYHRGEVKASTYRLIYVGLGLVLVAVVILTVAFSPSGEDVALPAPIERLFPRPNDSVIRQTAVEVDMAPGYDVVLFVDGFRVTPPELTVQPGTGVATWRPGPGRVIERWTPGGHELRVEWQRSQGLPDPGSFSWTFRVQ